MVKPTKSDIRNEALFRLGLLDAPDSLIEAARRGDVCKSTPLGEICALTDEEKAMVSNFESKYYVHVYHVLHQITHNSEIFTMLFLGNNASDWECEHENLNPCNVKAYAENRAFPSASGFRKVGLRPFMDGLARKW